jgi:maspardin
MSDRKWNGNDHYNDSSFIETSIRMPRQIFSNNRSQLTLTYRQLGDRSLEEAVIFIPSVYETESSCFRIAPLFDKAGYRFISFTTGNHETFESLVQTFDQFCRFLKIKRIHFIGVDLGGFICLQLQNTSYFTVKVVSLILINSYTRNDMYVPRNLTAFSFLGSFVAKNNLTNEIIDLVSRSVETNATLFIRKEIEQIGMSEAGSRIKLRMAMTPPLYLHILPQAIMSIEPLDRRTAFTTKFLPSLTLGGVKQAVMKYGGDFPHLDTPDDTFTYALCHIKKWSSPEDGVILQDDEEIIQNDEESIQEEEEQKQEEETREAQDPQPNNE